MKKKNSELTTTNWILSILGILVLSCFVVLPPVFRIFLKEEDKPAEKKIVAMTSCKKEQIDNSNYVDDEILTFTHVNDKIQNYKKETNRTYKDPMIYQEMKITYGQYVTAFTMIDGYQYDIHLDDNSSYVAITEKYDLTTFRPTMITIPGEENPTAITSTYQLDTEISTVKDYLTAYGYTCRELSS